MKAGQKIAVGFIVFGIILIGINIVLMNNSGLYFPKFLIAGIVFAFGSIGLLIKPGADIALDNNTLSELWHKGSSTDKGVWLAFVGISIVVCYIVFSQFGLEL